MNQAMESLLNSIPSTSFVFVLDPQGVYLHVRKPPDPTRCLPADGYLGKRLEDSLPLPLATPRRFFFDLAVTTKTVQTYGYPHPTTAGRWMACTLSPIVRDGNVEQVIMEVYDIAPFARIGQIYVNR